MPLDKKALLDRLEKMFWLSNDWDGFGSFPITKKVHDIGKEMIQMIEVNVDMQIYVGVEIDGSLMADIYRLNTPKFNRLELIILPEGTIDYEDIRDAEVINRGSFLLNQETINEIIR